CYNEINMHFQHYFFSVKRPTNLILITVEILKADLSGTEQDLISRLLPQISGMKINYEKSDLLAIGLDSDNANSFAELIYNLGLFSDAVDVGQQFNITRHIRGVKRIFFPNSNYFPMIWTTSREIKASIV
ncbi:hypothetical protein ACJX0J_041095, partial [Zea mays]